MGQLGLRERREGQGDNEPPQLPAPFKVAKRMEGAKEGT
jgi:hypothetical protein